MHALALASQVPVPAPPNFDLCLEEDENDKKDFEDEDDDEEVGDSEDGGSDGSGSGSGSGSSGGSSSGNADPGTSSPSPTQNLVLDGATIRDSSGHDSYERPTPMQNSSNVETNVSRRGALLSTHTSCSAHHVYLIPNFDTHPDQHGNE